MDAVAIADHVGDGRCAGLLNGAKGFLLKRGDPAGDSLAARIAEIASGAETAAERNGEREIAIWKRGVTL